MATIEMSRNHQLGKAEARKRAEQILTKMSSSYGITGAWSGDIFSITAPAKGAFTVAETAVQITLDLPFLLRPLKGKIESKITEEFDRTLK